jgi:hypothetical protein
MHSVFANVAAKAAAGVSVSPPLRRRADSKASTRAFGDQTATLCFVFRLLKLSCLCQTARTVMKLRKLRSFKACSPATATSQWTWQLT